MCTRAAAPPGARRTTAPEPDSAQSTFTVRRVELGTADIRAIIEAGGTSRRTSPP